MVCLPDPPSRSGVRKISSILERRSYDKRKTKAQLTSTLQTDSSDQIVVPVVEPHLNRSRSASMSDFPVLESENSGGPAQVCPSIPLRNSFELLEQQNNIDDVENEMTNVSQNIQTNSARCPPITVWKMSVQDINKLLYQLNGDGKFVLKNSKGAVQIRTKCSSLFVDIQEALKQLNAEFYTHATRDDASVKIVLSGLPVYNIEEIKTELAKNNISPREVKLLYKTRDNSSALYVLNFAKGTVKLNKLREVQYLFNVVVSWRHWTRRVNDILQCFRCQRFGHGSRHCNMQLRCVKCGKQHTSGDCTIPKKASGGSISKTHKDIKCANCGQNHAASFRECPYRLEFIKRQVSSVSRQNPNGGPAINPPRKFTSSWVTQNRSFAEVVSRPTTSEMRPEAANMTTERNNTNLFTLSEFLGLAREMFNRFRGCTSREEQFFALQELMAKYLYIH